MKSDKSFVFLCNKGFRNLEDRGGTQYLIRAYLEEFTKEDNVKMIIKVNPAYGIPDMNKFLVELGHNENSPEIIIDTNNYEYKDLVNLYNKCDVFVCPTRAEAFGIPMIEAMACGLPVITTNFGGQTDFVDKENGWLIGGELEEVKHEMQYEGIKWLTPNIEELKLIMRDAFSNPNILKQMSKHALETAKLYQWKMTAKRIVDLIGVG